MPKGVCFNTGRTHFKKGQIPWNAGTKGVMKRNITSFKKGHNAGVNHPKYNHGFSLTTHNRWVVVCRDGSKIYFSRIVVEGKIGRPLISEEIVHHINHNSLDDRIENLQILSRAEHIRHHRPQLYKRLCEA